MTFEKCVLFGFGFLAFSAVSFADDLEKILEDAKQGDLISFKTTKGIPMQASFVYAAGDVFYLSQGGKEVILSANRIAEDSAKWDGSAGGRARATIIASESFVYASPKNDSANVGVKSYFFRPIPSSTPNSQEEIALIFLREEIQIMALLFETDGKIRFQNSSSPAVEPVELLKKLKEGFRPTAKAAPKSPSKPLPPSTPSQLKR